MGGGISQERIAFNESAFREVNEAIRAGRALRDVSRTMPVVCECARLGCNDVLQMTIGDYERLRRNPRRFAVMPGHEMTIGEVVVEDHGEYRIVEKIGTAGDIAEEADPRQ
jgi:hypothetical protein